MVVRGRASHTHTRRGKRVRFRLKDGRTVEGRFEERRSRYVLLEDGTRVPTEDISCMTVVKGR
jgi:hypothetical protein